MRIATTIFATVAIVALTLSGLPGTAAAQTLPGFSAHPETAANSKARATHRREPATAEPRASAAQHSPSHGTANTVSEPIYFGLANAGVDD
jgi:hypothetical protein